MDYPSNSNKQKYNEVKPKSKHEDKPEGKNVERITSGEVIRKKKSIGRRFKEMFAGGDGRSVISYILVDVFIPAVKDMIVDASTQGIERMIFGDATPRSRGRGSRPGSSNGYIAYNRYTPKSSWQNRDEPREITKQARASHNFDEIIISTRGEAEEVLDMMQELISKFGYASVSDLYQLTGVEGNYTDDRWGWKDLRGVSADRLRQGYLLNLPRPEYLQEA